MEISLPAAAAGSAATLYFDLIGFGANESRVLISDVQFNSDSTEQNLPTVSIALDESSDSGIVGDGITNISTVEVQGRTEPGVTVSIDSDTDGLNDATVTADADGN